jgi:hypothetical protein
LDIGQLKEWITRHIISEHLEHRIDMTSKRPMFISFTSEQVGRPQHSIFFGLQNDTQTSISSDCSQSEPLSCLPTGLNMRRPSADFEMTRSSVDSVDPSDSTVHPEGLTEHRGGIVPMATSALEQNSSIPSQGPDRQLPGETSLSGGGMGYWETREMTEPENRPEVSEEELNSLWVILSRRIEFDFEQRHLAGMEMLKRTDTLDMSDDQLEWIFKAGCIDWNTAICCVALSAARARRHETEAIRVEWMRIAPESFAR